MERYRYEIGGRMFTQGELVLSQEEDLADLLGPLFEGEADLTPQRVADLLLRQKKLRRALAIVLVPEGQSVAERSVQDVEEALLHACTLGRQMEVVRDFFACNAEAAKRLPDMASDLAALARAEGP